MMISVTWCLDCPETTSMFAMFTLALAQVLGSVAGPSLEIGRARTGSGSFRGLKVRGAG